MTDLPDLSILSPAARDRLAQHRGFALSGTAGDLARLESVGLAPIGFVEGVSAFPVHLDPTEPSWGGELSHLSRALHAARTYALARLVAEAAVLQASGVVAVSITDDGLPIGSGAVELVATGTAVRVRGEHRWSSHNGRPFTTSIPVEGLADLLGRRLVPLAVVFGCCVTGLDARAIAPGHSVTELGAVTQAGFDGREVAIARLDADAARIGAAGVLSLSVTTRGHTWAGRATEYLASADAVRFEAG